MATSDTSANWWPRVAINLLTSNFVCVDYSVIGPGNLSYPFSVLIYTHLRPSVKIESSDGAVIAEGATNFIVDTVTQRHATLITISLFVSGLIAIQLALNSRLPRTRPLYRG